MDGRVETLLHMERAEPKRRVFASGGALYAVLLAAVILAIVVGNDISGRFLVPRAYVQPALYAVLALAGYCFYRFRLLSYRYTLTDRTPGVDRILGGREQKTVRVALSDISQIRPFSDRALAPPVRPAALYRGRRRDALYILYRKDGARGALLLSPSDTLKGKLFEQWKNAAR